MSRPQAFDQNDTASSLEESLGRAFARIAQPMQLVEVALKDTVHARAQVIGELGDHILNSGGKRLRPALVLLAAELVGYTGPRRIELAAALELLHTATLVHDDVVDLAGHRRGRPSANAIWGNRRAVLAGDFFYARASSMLIADGNLEIVESYSRTIGLLAEGELLQLERSFDIDITETHYYEVIERKSAALLSACCEIGCLLGEVTRTERNRICEYGRQLGIAFQLKDDCLDYDAELEVMGKQPFADLREGKITLPVVLAWRRGTDTERKFWRRTLESVEQGDGDLEEAFGLMNKYGALSDTIERSRHYGAIARDALGLFPESEIKKALRDLIDFCIERAY